MSIKGFFHRLKEARQAGFEIESLRRQQLLCEAGLSKASSIAEQARIASEIAKISGKASDFTKLQGKRFDWSRKTARANFMGALYADIKANRERIDPAKYCRVLQEIEPWLEKADIYRRIVFNLSYKLRKMEIADKEKRKKQANRH
ncbi:MAG: hypothetical protein N3G22_02905 [Candidatus Micrarchaeota archaeon]|nr:hypothetical protein [Candidatus Micrarchaeota archaeon]